MKIKTSIFYSLAAVTLMSGAANAQSDTATDPVGFHTIKVFGAAGGSPTFTLISAGLVNPIEFAGAATGITATTITVADNFTEDYGTDPGDPLNGTFPEAPYIAYYVEVTDGDEAGAWANITDTTDNVLTVDRDLSAAGDTAKIAIRKHVTIADLFGANNEAGLNPGASAAVADEVQFFVSGSATVYIYDNSAGFEGWWDPGFTNFSNNIPIEPQQGVYVRRKIAGDVEFTRAGHVKVGTKLNVNVGYNAMANPRAVGKDDLDSPVFTLGESDLYNGTDPTNSIVAGASAATADEITLFDDTNAPSVYIYDDSAGYEGYWDPGFVALRDDVVIENGRGFLLRRKAGLAGGGTPFVWTVPAETIAE